MGSLSSLFFVIIFMYSIFMLPLHLPITLFFPHSLTLSHSLTPLLSFRHSPSLTLPPSFHLLLPPPFASTAREHIVGWYHTGPKLHPNDIAIHELINKYCNNPVSCNHLTIKFASVYLVPRLHPAFQHATLKAGWSLGMRLHLNYICCQLIDP